jgi:hypothetical protein
MAMNPSYHRTAQTIPFSSAAAATATLFTPRAGMKFIVTKWYFIAGAGQTILFDSKPAGAATNLTGAIPLQADLAYSDGDGDEAVLVGNAIGDALRITTGNAVQTDGYVVVGQMQGVT